MMVKLWQLLFEGLLLAPWLFLAPWFFLAPWLCPGVLAQGTGQPAESATPGYVEDKICAQCHRELYESYKTVGMSRAFSRPGAENVIEDFKNNHFYHQASQRHYEMIQREDRLFLKRYLQGPAGEERDVLEREIHWVLGSGSKARSYIHQTEWGELFQLPISWYTQSGTWGMAPGYDTAQHQGFSRRVQRDCMFCHNAYPEVPAGSDVSGAPQIFPKELPNGLGCQRCHGPGATHVRLSFDLDASEEEMRAAIFNPQRLDPAQRDEVCLQCHLQPSVTLSGVRRFERPMYSYRAGQPLDDYLVYMDVVEKRPKEERFEINHHPYRLHQSRCFLESKGALSCLTCHDPHHKPSGETARFQFRDACLSCHQREDCQLDAMAETVAAPHGVAADDCTACHMSPRRTQDVVGATMTDHLIRRRPGGSDLIAQIPEQEHFIQTVEFLRPEKAPEGPLAEVYLQLAMVRGGSRTALTRLRTALETARPEHVEPYLELAVGELNAGHFADAETTLEKVLAMAPEHITARLHLGVALAAQGKTTSALQHLLWAFERAPEWPLVRFNLGKTLVQLGRIEEAIPHLEAAVKARPLLDAGWLELGNAQARAEHFTSAVDAYREALAVEPRLASARQNLVEALLRLELHTQAMAELKAWVHLEPESVWPQQRLKSLESIPPTDALH